ncbi:Epoxide hydrolase domain protein [Mycena sanguinolenta]|uniref:Epoxide hydrolase domain protein n=1 Tax=Mycena sanguinolenta TaxID=230812 RepID=A0A8H6XC16_9AGAR|nr:Epoxide hydrolase domain protein [Mycena sanguinolenta]
MVLSALFLAFLSTPIGGSSTRSTVQPFKVDLASGFPHLQTLVKNTNLPTEPLYSDAGPDFGLDLATLREWQTQWVNGFAQFTTTIGNQTVHFIHEKSQDKDAVPLLLLHGWPGTVAEFLPIIKPLTQSWTDPTTGKNISFNMVVPSIPGFLFSSSPPQNWTNVEIAGLFNTLMTDVLGYSKYALHGTDWGGAIGYNMYESFNTTVRAANFALLPFVPPSPQDIASDNITISALESVALQHTVNWRTEDQGYFQEQTFKPNDIGLALYDNPVGQLAWIGSGLVRWSDPRAGTAPSTLNSTTILNIVSLFYLSGTFQSGVWQYAHNPNLFRTEYTKPVTDAPMWFSLFEYDIFWPQEYVAKVGNLIAYREHDFGGHFAGVDNPPALIEDLREMGLYFAANE